MSNVSKAYIPWRDRAYLSLDEAGLIVARSADWIRTRICEGQLEGHRHQKGGPLVVTVASVAALVDRTVDPLPAHRVRRRPVSGSGLHPALDEVRRTAGSYEREASDHHGRTLVGVGPQPSRQRGP